MSSHASPRTVSGLHDFFERMAELHPPLSLAETDMSVKRPELVRSRFGHVFDYLTRVELEVERNVLEIQTLLPHASATDVLFHRDVWHPQELQHGVLLDELLSLLGMPAATPDVGNVGTKLRAAGAMGHLPGLTDVFRLIYYLTGAATERAAGEAYSRLHRGLIDLSEVAIAETAVAPIRRQEPGHYTFYRRSAEHLVRHERFQRWQMNLTRILRSRSFGLVGANNPAQVAQFGDVALALSMDTDLVKFAQHISRVERELLWDRRRGLQVPGCVRRALEGAVESLSSFLCKRSVLGG